MQEDKKQEGKNGDKERKEGLQGRYTVGKRKKRREREIEREKREKQKECK